MISDTIKKSALFKNFTEAEISDILKKLKAKEVSFEKGEEILSAGSIQERLGLVSEGSVTIESNDVWGNKNLLSHVSKGGFFAETYALLENEPMLVDVIANENCRILFLTVGSLRKLMSANNPCTLKLITNLLSISAHKNLMLSGRSFHISPKTIRGKVMAYLNTLSLQKDSKEFDIPFDRQQLADYLNVERTALSKELSKMQNDGIITFSKNHFEIHAEA